MHLEPINKQLMHTVSDNIVDIPICTACLV